MSVCYKQKGGCRAGRFTPSLLPVLKRSDAYAHEGCKSRLAQVQTLSGFFNIGRHLNLKSFPCAPFYRFYAFENLTAYTSLILRKIFTGIFSASFLAYMVSSHISFLLFCQ